jgi:hypothetical protein
MAVLNKMKLCRQELASLAKITRLNFQDHAEEARMEIPRSPINLSTGDHDANR